VGDASGAPSRGTVLVVDDEPILRDLAVKILARAGYRTLGADDAVEAIAQFEQAGGEIDLMLTDVVMPGMGGPQLAAELTQRRPTLKVIFTSGYTDDMVVRYGIDGMTMDFLGKPYSMRDLLARVEATLAQG
jgi:CheY-like chemotaxis protein